MEESLAPEMFNKTDLQKGQDDPENIQQPEYELTKEQVRKHSE